MNVHPVSEDEVGDTVQDLIDLDGARAVVCVEVGNDVWHVWKEDPARLPVTAEVRRAALGQGG